MRETDKKMKKILEQDIQLSDTVNQKLQDTYKMLEEKELVQKRRKPYVTKLCTAAAAVMIFCAIPAVVYAAVKTDFFEGMFGNETKQSNAVIHKKMDDGKGKIIDSTIPAREYVAVDEAKADSLIGEWVADKQIVRKVGSHTLTIENFTYDANGALMYFTLEREGGVTALKGNSDTNLTKGAYFTEKADFMFLVESSQGIPGYDNIYIDTEKSTSEKIYCYSYILWGETLEEKDIPQLVIESYPCTRREMEGMDEREVLKKIKEEKVSLSDKGQIPTKTIDLGEDGKIIYSPISISIDMTKGFGLSKEEAEDPGNMNYLAVQYSDGSSYIVSDKEKI